MQIGGINKFILTFVILAASANAVRADVTKCSGKVDFGKVLLKGSLKESKSFIKAHALFHGYEVKSGGSIEDLFVLQPKNMETWREDGLEPMLFLSTSNAGCRDAVDKFWAPAKSKIDAGEAEREKEHQEQLATLEKKKRVLQKQIDETESAQREREERDQSLQFMMNGADKIGAAISGADRETVPAKSVSYPVPDSSGVQGSNPSLEFDSGHAPKCGHKPFAHPGCTIGRCVNGEWEEVCSSRGIASCGHRPHAGPGCRVDRCVNGEWEVVCDANPGASCGARPALRAGCRLGRCVNGAWEQNCR